ncbi:hypothetical protein CAEBREN_18444 [Caenorhabditis brenneri]|uniref:Uncharacterized protein n=1 Tax=Caenorhabditis brenneri TaxID=135651 RepID=G0N837_CAEBE|nr:hypothetical protein CAEBREN_18444 [Caenorhabditis brenneri]
MTTPNEEGNEPDTASQPSIHNNSSATSEAEDSNSGHCSNHSRLCMVVSDNFDPLLAIRRSKTFRMVFTCCGSYGLVPFNPPPPKPIVIAHPSFNDRCNQCFVNIGKMKAAEEKLKNEEKKAKLYEKQAEKTEELEKEIMILQTKRKNADKHRLEAKEELDKAVNLATRNEKKAQKTDELEENLKVKNAKLQENKKEIDDLKRTITSQPDLAQKVVALEKRLASQEVIEKKLRESNKEFLAKNANREKQLEIQTQQNQLDREKFAAKYGKMQDEMAENRTLSAELATQNLALAKENAQFKADALLKEAALEEKLDINARLLNEKVQLYQKIKDMERQLQKFNGALASE